MTRHYVPEGAEVLHRKNAMSHCPLLPPLLLTSPCHSRWRALDGAASVFSLLERGTVVGPNIPRPLPSVSQKQVTSQSDALLLLLLLTDNMWLREELLKSIWHAFTALDVDHRGKVSKSQLKVRVRPVSLSPVTTSCPMETILFQTELKVHLQRRDDCSGSSKDRGAAGIFCQTWCRRLN